MMSFQQEAPLGKQSVGRERDGGKGNRTGEPPAATWGVPAAAIFRVTLAVLLDEAAEPTLPHPEYSPLSLFGLQLQASWGRGGALVGGEGLGFLACSAV